MSSQEDTNGDGAIDKWETYTNGALSSVAFDPERDGRPTRRLIYRSDGELERVETEGIAAAGGARP